MRFLLATLLTALLSFIAGLFLPWWGIAIVALLVGILVRQIAGMSFLAGFLGVFLLWVGIAWWIDLKNNSILSERIANVFPLGGNTFLLLVVTGFLGGLVGGFAAMSGAYLRPRTK